MPSSRTPDSHHQESGRELRSESFTEKWLAAGGTNEAYDKTFEENQRKALIPFHELCDSERKGDTGTIQGVRWKICRSEGEFDSLFWPYWRDRGQKLAEGNPLILVYYPRGSAIDSTPLEVRYSEAACEQMSALARDPDAWEKEGEKLLKSWKEDGVPLADFLALTFVGIWILRVKLRSLREKNVLIARCRGSDAS